MKLCKVYAATPGIVWPEEYDWQEQFSNLDTLEPFTKVDTGKLIGLLMVLEIRTEALEKLEADLDLAELEGPL